MSEIKMLPLPEVLQGRGRTTAIKNYARAVAEHNVSRALAESDHSLRAANAGLALALEQAEANVKARDAEIEALRAEVGELHMHAKRRDQYAVEKAAQALDWKKRAELLAEALQWYAEQAEGCRKIGSIGEPFRKELDRDGGKRARAALRDHDQEGKDG